MTMFSVEQIGGSARDSMTVKCYITVDDDDIVKVRAVAHPSTSNRAVEASIKFEHDGEIQSIVQEVLRQLSVGGFASFFKGNSNFLMKAPDGSVFFCPPPKAVPCHEEDSGIFSPNSREEMYQAMSICERCPIMYRRSCDESAVRNEESGVWGGRYYVFGEEVMYPRFRRQEEMHQRADDFSPIPTQPTEAPVVDEAI